MLGQSIPFENPHALSVSLPAWDDIVRWASGDALVISQMSTGYPRFFIHRKIQELAAIIIAKYKSLCLLFPTDRAANECTSYLSRHSRSQFHTTLIPVHPLQLHVVFVPQEYWKLAKSFWQHAGMGISSRYAEACLSLMQHSQLDPFVTLDQPASIAKMQLRNRIATLASYGDTSPPDHPNHPRLPAEHDVFLFPTGMSAIWHAHRMTLSWRPGLRPVCFGFPYIDTYQVLQKWGPGCHFFGHHPDSNLAALEAFLASNDAQQSPPVSAVFCECPSNPLLHSTNIVRLRQLADQYNFAIIVDDTIGTFVNTALLDFVDVITTSLSKLFSGQADVMGGSLVLNPNSPYYEVFRSHIQSVYVDDYFPPDAIKMEFNSRDFASRVRVINVNAHILCTFLRSRSRSQNDTAPDRSLFVIKDVFYPEFTTRSNYDMSRRKGMGDNFGPLFSLTFVSQTASEAFYNSLPCAKGPSLGTNFTLVCPYTILAHYNELEWVAQFGVEEGIVRVSVGMEGIETLMGWFRHSLDVAEASVNGFA